MGRLCFVCIFLLSGLVAGSHAVCLAQTEDLEALYNQVIKLYNAGKYAEAIPLGHQYAEATKKQFGEHSPEYATALNNLAEFNKAQGRYADAEPLFKRALVIYEKALGPDHPLVATSINNLAELYRHQGRYAVAEPLHKRALGIREKALGPDHSDVGLSLNNLAALYKSQGRYAEAEPYYKRALGILEKALGPDHPDVAINFNNLAELYKHQGRYAEAEPHYKRAIDILEKALGPDHPLVATGLNNLALLYVSQSRYADAEPLYKRSLGILEKALGPGHPDVAQSLNNLAGLYLSQGRYAETEPLYKRSLGIREKALGPDHPDIAASLNNLAGLYGVQGRYADAEPLYKRSLGILEKALGPDHPHVGANLVGLAGLYENQGRYGAAEPLYKRALSIWEKALGPDHPRVGTSLNLLAEFYRAQGRYAEAEPLHRRALGIREKVLGPDHRFVATSLNNLALVYVSQSRYADAEPLYKRSLGILEKVLGPDHPNVAASLNNLAALYRHLNRLEEAESYFKRADAIPDPTTKKVRIYFATNRLVEKTGSATLFGTERGKRLEIGQANVIVPRKELETRTTRAYSGAGLSSYAEAKLTSSAQLIIRKIDHIAEGKSFAGKLGETLSRSHRFKNQAVVFVHGFNVTFDEAVSRTAQLCFELEFDGPCLVFTWPSVKRVSGYGTDRQTALWSADFLVEMLQRLATELPETIIHLMAHSMGNVVTLQALEKLASKGGSASKVKIGEVILAHPDVESSQFAELIKNGRPLNAGFTLYSSEDDWAIWVSGLIGGAARAGGTKLFAEGLDTIDVTGLGANFLSFNHSVFAENPIVFNDITKLLQTGERPPDKRTELFEAVDKEGKKYWRYKAAIPVTATRGEGGLDLIDVLGSGR